MNPSTVSNLISSSSSQGTGTRLIGSRKHRLGHYTSVCKMKSRKWHTHDMFGLCSCETPYVVIYMVWDNSDIVITQTWRVYCGYRLVANHGEKRRVLSGRSMKRMRRDSGQTTSESELDSDSDFIVSSITCLLHVLWPKHLQICYSMT